MLASRTTLYFDKSMGEAYDSVFGDAVFLHQRNADGNVVFLEPLHEGFL